MIDYRNETITILYGSETGNSQELAERIWRESKCYYFSGPILCMDDYNVEHLINETCVIFVCSTTGQGEEPENMRRFWRFLLRKSLSKDSLINLRFAVLGLGDSSYVKFNFAAKRLNKRLSQLGGNCLQPIGLGDEQHDLGRDAVANPWIDSLWNKLNEVYPLPKSIKPLSRTNIVPRWNVKTKLLENVVIKTSQQSIYYSTKPETEFTVKVLDNIRETSKTHFQDVRLLRLQTEGEKYLPGDIIILRPKNHLDQIKEFERILQENQVNIDENTIFSVSQITGDVPVPNPLKYQVTFRQLCEEYFDLTAVPRRYTFCVLGHLTDNELEREKCNEFISPEGQDAMYDYATRPHRTIVEVLQDFPHATKNITHDILFEIFPPIKPRDFSIASSFKAHQNEIHILVAIVKYKTNLKKERMGLCSNFLAGLKVGDKISVWTKKGTFQFPKETDSPVIMVGPGTGMSAFRSYIHERVADGTATKENLTLFFGCRGEKTDFLCKEEFLTFEKENKLNLFVAFSRDQDYKIYVQHKIKDNMDLVWNLLKNEKCHVYVAGSSKSMPQDVRSAFVAVCIEKGGLTPDSAEEFIANMEKYNRYQQETWF
nr:NADPH-dependent diflavin oxidoreductase 1 isoform X1 [Onthophagus taurus]